MGGRGRIVAGLGLALVVALGALAYAGEPSNGGFEAKLKGWNTKSSDRQTGKWLAYEKGDDVFGGPAARGLQATSYPAPPVGKRAAAAAQSAPGARFMYRTLKLKDVAEVKLSMLVAIRNYADRFASPRHFRFGGGGETATRRPYIAGARRGMVGPPSNANQQYRIDVLKANAPLRSLKGSDILKTVFRTKPGDRKRQPFHKVKVDLSKYAGKKVRLRFAEVDNLGIQITAVDQVKLKYG